MKSLDYKLKSADHFKLLLSAVCSALTGSFILYGPAVRASECALSSSFSLGASQIFVCYDDGLSEQLQKDSLDWVKSSAQSVAHYYGKFPVKTLQVKIHVRDGHGFGLGIADLHHGKAEISIPLGRETAKRELKEDWVLTHEMVHLAFPLVRRSERWLVEGMATYVEPFARLQTGALTAQDVWGDMLKNCPKGQARSAEETLKSARRIPRIYWGGATFCLLADLKLRESSKNKFGMQDALAAIVKQGTSIRSNKDARKALLIADKSLGVDILANLYDDLAGKAENPDLQSIFSSLGVSKEGNAVKFNNSAPLAQIRQSIESGASNPEQAKSQ